MDIAAIKAGIVAKIVSDTDFSADSVFDYEPAIDEKNVDPYAFVVPTEMDSEFGNTAENRRDFMFNATTNR